MNSGHYATALIMFAIGAAVGLFFTNLDKITCENFQFVNKDFACGNEQIISKGNYTALKNDLVDVIADRQSVGDISFAAVYFRDLRGGPTMGINESTEFVPASLLKVPLVLGYLNYAESMPKVMDEKILYDRDNVRFVKMLEQTSAAPVPLTEGEYYPIEELLRYTLSHSDNLAYYLLVEYFNINIPEGSQRLLHVFQDLGVIDPRDPNEQVVSVRNYAGLFRQLYNSSYLNPEQSELVLSWLAESVFDTGLDAGVPEGVKVAHKFGERILPEGTKQLHDCGIVYYPGNPYLLCVMTTGREWQDMAEVIATISQMVYEEVDSRRL